MSTDRSARRPARLLVVCTVLLVASSAGCRIGLRSERHATATLFDAGGAQVGVVSLTEGGSGVSVSGRFRSLAPGQHGIHIHAVGRCDGAGAFASAGPHFNPGMRKHGLSGAGGPHAGDLPNVDVGPSGTAAYEATNSRVSLGEGRGSLLDADGSVVVIHAMLDDQRTDPAGNSGARVACGVIRAR